MHEQRAREFQFPKKWVFSARGRPGAGRAGAVPLSAGGAQRTGRLHRAAANQGMSCHREPDSARV